MFSEFLGISIKLQIYSQNLLNILTKTIKLQRLHRFGELKIYGSYGPPCGYLHPSNYVQNTKETKDNTKHIVTICTTLINSATSWWGLSVSRLHVAQKILTDFHEIWGNSRR